MPFPHEVVHEAGGLGQRFHEALVFAAQLHAQQKRKGSRVPYVAHLLAVASIALEHGAGEDEAIAALLHDAAEDQGGMPTLALIRDRFGEEVAAIVAGCSDSYQDMPDKPPWEKRKATYIEAVKSAGPSVLLVSASDKLHNLRSILMDYRLLGVDLWPRFRGGKVGTLWYYRELMTVYRETELSRGLLEELEVTLSTLIALVTAREGDLIDDTP